MQSCFTHLHILQNRKLHNLISLWILQWHVTEQKRLQICVQLSTDLLLLNFSEITEIKAWSSKQINKSMRVFLSSIQTDTISILLLLSPECWRTMHYSMHPLQGGCPPNAQYHPNCYTTLKIQSCYKNYYKPTSCNIILWSFASENIS